MTADMYDDDEPESDDPMSLVWVEFTAEHNHAELPFGPGDVFQTELHNALSIEAAGTGHRVPDPNPPETDA